MFKIDVEAETARFAAKFISGSFLVETSMNTEEEYTKKKQPRDTEAIKAFVFTEEFEELVKMK